jgi:acyl-lipid omega-6 desaturase (Delta-12 desaturase)
MHSEASHSLPDRAELYKMVRPYSQPDVRKATWQLINTFVPYATLWALMIFTIQRGYSYWITLALAVPAAFFLVRIFIFFHDCCHRSFFASDTANTVLGYITGILTFTPYHEWRHSHNHHHATVADLDRRGTGDVWTMTVEEYRNASWWQRLAYRLYRHPLVTFGLGPMFIFLLSQRVPGKGADKEVVRSVMITNLAILAILGLAAVTIGVRTYILIQLPVILIAGTLGVWLFYVQHQFEGVYWARHENWEPLRAALEGSSYYKLPEVLRWLTGNIGLHHVHHVRPRIPNYNLQACLDAVPALQDVNPLTVGRSLKSPWLDLWDEERQQLIRFRKAHRLS